MGSVSERKVVAWLEGPLETYPSLTLHLHMPEKEGALYWRFSRPESTPCASMLFKTNDDPFSQADVNEADNQMQTDWWSDRKLHRAEGEP
jgi:hypothetical protein